MELKPRIDIEGRTDLTKVLPLDTPFLVFLDPSSFCNGHCYFCPSGNQDFIKQYRKDKMMPLPRFKRIIDDLCKMPEPIKTLRLYKDGEPLLNQHLAKMVKYANNTGRFKSIDTTTNGLALTVDRAIELIKAGIDKIFVSVPNNYSDQYRLRLQTVLKYKGDCEFRVKIIGNSMTEDQKLAFLDDFQDADRVFIENMVNCWPCFDFKHPDPDKGIYNQKIIFVNACPYLFYSLAINSDATVSMCFLDWSRTLVIGDLKVQSFSSIWNGEKLKAFRKLHLKFMRKFNPMCANCKQLIYGAPDSIDLIAKELLEKL